MLSQRSPWWLYTLAALFLFDFGLQIYCVYQEPEDFGIRGKVVGKRLIVDSLAPASPAERAGLRAGDRILTVDDQPVQGDSYLRVIAAEQTAEKKYRIEIEREGRQFEVQIPIELAKLSLNPTSGAPSWEIANFIQLALAIFIAFSKPGNLIARLAAATLATYALDNGLYRGFAPFSSHLPWLLNAVFMAAYGAHNLDGPLALSFAALFPRRLFRVRWIWWVIWLPPICLALMLSYYTFLMVYHPAQAFGTLREWVYLRQRDLYFAFPLVALGVFVANYLRLTDANDKRRLRVLLLGVGGCIIPIAAWFLSTTLAPASRLAALTNSKGYQLWQDLMMALFPGCVAYAVLRHRLFDIRVVIRQSLRYALARRILVSAVPALASILAIDLMLHRAQTVAQIFLARGWIYGALAGAALLAHSRRQQWLLELDRCFFRERYDAQRLLREVVEEVGKARSFQRVAPSVVSKIETALHPQFAALMVRDPGQTNFRTLTAVPAGEAPAPLSAESKLMTLLRVLGKPMDLSLAESGWLKQQLPHEETDFLRQARIDMLIPIAVSPETTEALLVLGAKRSEEPYAREDQDLLMAIAASLALLIDKTVTAPTPVSPEPAISSAPAGALVYAAKRGYKPVRAVENLEECPQCGTCYDSGTGQCATDGAGLIAAHMPRVLAGRYRLDRRRGRGGMGEVYEAEDAALARRVAVKVIRQDLLASADAAGRFRREARAAAGFTHPNVVIIHDFGVEAGSLAFLVMELLHGVDLRGVLRLERKLPPRRIVQILLGVAAAVEAAHRRQLVHRDLKPENIFLVQPDVESQRSVTPQASSVGAALWEVKTQVRDMVSDENPDPKSEAEGRWAADLRQPHPPPAESGYSFEIVKILDFGLAKFIPTGAEITVDTGTGQMVGTPRYMSPDQLRGGPVEPAWDLWALAVVAYEMLTGSPPFPGRTVAECHSAILDGRFTPISTHLPEGPARWQEFFARCFARDPKRRAGTARALHNELEQILT